MSLQENHLGGISERLLTDFSGQILLPTMLTMLRECAADNPDADPALIEQATRIQIQIQIRRQ